MGRSHGGGHHHQLLPMLVVSLLLALSTGGSDSGSSRSGVAPQAQLPAELEHSALRELAALPAAMAAAAADRSRAARLAQKRMRKKACKKHRRVACALRLARALAASGQHAAAVAAAREAALDPRAGSGSLTEPFTLFWLAQQAAHINALPDPDTVLEEAASLLFGRVRELRAAPDLLNCVGLLEAQRREQQATACSSAVDSYCSDEDTADLLPCSIAQHWSGLLHLDSVVGGQLPDELSPLSPSEGWRAALPDRRSTRLLSAGCASLAAAAAGGAVEPTLLLANHSCAQLYSSTVTRREGGSSKSQSMSPTAVAAAAAGNAAGSAFKPVRRIDRSTVTAATKGGTKKVAGSRRPHEAVDSEETALSFWQGVVEAGEPVVFSTRGDPATGSTGGGALGLGRHGWESIRTICGEQPLPEGQAAYLGATAIDSVNSAASTSASTATATAAASGGENLKLKDGLVSSQAAVRLASLDGQPVGVSGWAVSECPALAETIDWPEVAMAARGRSTAEKPTEDGGGDDDVWGWSSPRVWACPHDSSSGLHSDLHYSHHVLALLEGGPKEYVIFPADAETRSRLLYNAVKGKFELGQLDEATGKIPSDAGVRILSSSLCHSCLHDPEAAALFCLNDLLLLGPFRFPLVLFCVRVFDSSLSGPVSCCLTDGLQVWSAEAMAARGVSEGWRVVLQPGTFLSKPFHP